MITTKRYCYCNKSILLSLNRQNEIAVINKLLKGEQNCSLHARTASVSKPCWPVLNNFVNILAKFSTVSKTANTLPISDMK